MKVVIIGGGIAGMAMGSFLKRKGIETVICEKVTGSTERGHAFLMHAEAIAILSELAGNRRNGLLPGIDVGAFQLFRPDGLFVKKAPLDGWRCMKRCTLTAYLEALLPPGTVKGGRVFSHFIHEQGRVVAAAFTNGETEYGDLFIGADGGNSRVRESLFGEVQMSEIAVKEIVGMTINKTLAQRYAGTFVKYQEADCGLAFGMIPTGKEEIVWFMQYDLSMGDVAENDPAALADFCRRMLAGFPPEVQGILRANDFSKSYVWHTRDFDLLPAFHKGNVVLIGDAAHLTLPFTSAGTTNAMVDAKVLANCIDQWADTEEAFRAYYRLRSGIVEEHIRLGRELKKVFLTPAKRAEAPLPFLSSSGGEQRLRVQYFTDPICSTCWIIQPAWKKLNLEYGHCLDIEYIMGGLLPSWKDCKGKIQSPSDAAMHWKEVADCYKMPLDAGVWTEDPLSSSFPPSIGFKAAQLQDEQKAQLFLRRVREMIFLEKKNIMKWRFLETAALEVGLDTSQFRADYVGAAREAFEADLALAAEHKVVSFPTLIFSDSAGHIVRLKGYQHYQDFEKAILQLAPWAVKADFNQEPESLFRHFPTMVDAEFALLSNLLRKEARKLLQRLNNEGYIEKVESENGVLWKMK
jgi:2-polyprenyl-6-methoxyphenol hydroxylase-like FAD-dependent oxidoreductase/predicted DsbA family dithiol-disulfide isomerase